MEDEQVQKGANQIWKESGTTLNFPEWIEREKAKGSFIPNKMVADTTALIKKNILKENNVIVPKTNNNTIFGLNKWILITTLVAMTGAIVFSIYNKKK